MPRVVGFNPRARDGREVAMVLVSFVYLVGFNPRARDGREK